MRNFFNWQRDDDINEEAYNNFRIALTQQFNTKYGRDAESLASWQLLCGQIGVNPIPNTLKECRQVSLSVLHLVRFTEQT
jgi:hypothetical protein